MSEEDYKVGYRDGIVAGEVERAAIIKECAMVVLNFEVGDSPQKIKLCEQLAAAIRALKNHD